MSTLAETYKELVDSNPTNNFWWQRGSSSTEVTMCCAGLYRGSRESIRVFPSFRKTHDVNSKEAKFWFGYMLNRAPWSEAFKTKTVSSFLRTGSLLEPKVDLYKAHQAGMSMRKFYENPFTVEMFYFLCKKGFNEHFALWLSEWFIGIASPNEMYADSEYHGRIFNHSVSIRNLVEGEYVKLKKKAFEDSGSYTGVYSSTEGGFTLGDTTRKEIKIMANIARDKRKAVVQTGYVNPFKRGLELRNTRPSREDWVEALTSFCKSHKQSELMFKKG